MQRWPITAVAVGALLFASALEIHLHRRPTVAGRGVASFDAVDVTPAERAALDGPDDAGVWVDLAEAYAAAGRMEDAMKAFTTARRIDANHPRVAARPDWASGADLLDVERAVLEDPANDEMWGRAADTLAAMGDQDRAIAYYLRALKLDPEDSEWPGKLIALGPDPRIDRFIADWSLTAGTGDDESLGDLADGLKQSGRWREACGFYQRALEVDPNDNEWVEAVDECSRRFPGEFQSASEASLQAFQRRLASNPRDDELLGDYADALRELGRDDEACVQYARAAAADPSDSEWLRALVRCPGHQGDIASLRANAAGDDEAVGDIGDVLWEVGRLTEACETYREALRLDPSDEEWREAMERCRSISP